MATLDDALAITLDNEGHYARDPWGGETYRGVSRVYHPDWPGWGIVDPVVNALGGDVRAINAVLRGRDDLNVAVADFYAKYFWQPLELDRVDRQAVANKVFDIAVLSGHVRAWTILQMALNALNNNGRLYADLAEDGRPGPVTRAALQTCLMRGRRAEDITELMHVLYGHHLYEKTRETPEKERYLVGWVRRSRRGAA